MVHLLDLPPQLSPKSIDVFYIYSKSSSNHPWLVCGFECTQGYSDPHFILFIKFKMIIFITMFCFVISLLAFSEMVFNQYRYLSWLTYRQVKLCQYIFFDFAVFCRSWRLVPSSYFEILINSIIILKLMFSRLKKKDSLWAGLWRTVVMQYLAWIWVWIRKSE